MSKEEYFKAFNSRITKIKSTSKSNGHGVCGQSSEDYFNFIISKNGSGP